MPKPSRARCATRCPIAPCADDAEHAAGELGAAEVQVGQLAVDQPALRRAGAARPRRSRGTSVSSRPSVKSATESALRAGVNSTGTPRAGARREVDVHRPAAGRADQPQLGQRVEHGGVDRLDLGEQQLRAAAAATSAVAVERLPRGPPAGADHLVAEGAQPPRAVVGQLGGHQGAHRGHPCRGCATLGVVRDVQRSVRTASGSASSSSSPTSPTPARTPRRCSRTAR